MLLTPDDLRKWVTFGSSSPLYEELVGFIADDPELLAFLNRIEHFPQPNMLLAGVQYLLMDDPGQPLAAHFPNLGGAAEDPGDLKDVFRDFVLGHHDELLEIGRTRYTQTNECRRCAVLLPLIWLTPFSGFHLVDVGTSAGLNLHLDRYHYGWGDVEWGPVSEVNLETENRGAAIAPRPIQVLSRTGLDLNPIDPGDPDDRMWLDALIWPEHQDRRERLRSALLLASCHPVRLVAGDALETIGPQLAGLPDGEPAIVMHSFALLQFADDQRTTFRGLLDETRRDRPVWEIGFDAYGRSDGTAGLTVDDGSGVVEVGRAQPHGEWVEIYIRP